MQVVLQVLERDGHDDYLVALAVNEERALRKVEVTDLEQPEFVPYAAPGARGA